MRSVRQVKLASTRRNTSPVNLDLRGSFARRNRREARNVESRIVQVGSHGSGTKALQGDWITCQSSLTDVDVNLHLHPFAPQLRPDNQQAPPAPRGRELAGEMAAKTATEGVAASQSSRRRRHRAAARRGRVARQATRRSRQTRRGWIGDTHHHERCALLRAGQRLAPNSRGDS